VLAALVDLTRSQRLFRVKNVILCVAAPVRLPFHTWVLRVQGGVDVLADELG
jgi:hypothetical protein